MRAFTIERSFLQRAIPLRLQWVALGTVLLLGLGGVSDWGLRDWLGNSASNKRSMPGFVAPISGSGSLAVLSSDSSGFSPILKPTLSAVVNISSARVVKIRGGNPFEPFFSDPLFRDFLGRQFQPRMPREQREHSLGSGVIVSSDGYVLTNNHVVDSASEIKVSLPDKREFKAKIVGTDPKTDLAVIKIEAKSLPTVVMGDSSKIQVGDLAFAIGDPFGIGETATMGIVSATGRRGFAIEDYEDFIQTDAAINPGNSGGALINARGELIGINTAIITGGGGGNQGIGFAIPINMAKSIMDQILKKGKVVRGYLGVTIQELSPEVARAFHAPEGKGALITDVQADGPGAKAGLKRGDIIEAVNDKPVAGVNDLRLQISEIAPGTTVRLKIVRDEHERSVEVTLGELPEKASASPAERPADDSPLRGVQVDELTPSVQRELGLRPAANGLVVTEVDSDSPAAEAGLRSGDVIEEINHQSVTNVREFNRLTRQAGKQSVLLLVNRGGNTTFIVVEPH
jgi:serine protease Do